MTAYAYRVEDLGPYAVDPMAHEKLASMFARRFRCANLDHEDLRQEAMTALCAAARNHNLVKCAFTTWAAHIIEGHLKVAVVMNRRSGMFGHRNQHATVIYKLHRFLTTHPDATIADARVVLLGVKWSGWTPGNATDDAVARAMIFATELEWRLDRETHHGDAYAPSAVSTLVDAIVDEAHERDTEDAALMSEWRALLERVPENDRERELIACRLATDAPDTLKEIGDRWGLSRERVRQIEEKLIGRLHAAAVAAGLRDAKHVARVPDRA